MVDDEVITGDAAVGIDASVVNCDAAAEDGCRPHDDVANDDVASTIVADVNEDDGDDDVFIADG